MNNLYTRKRKQTLIITEGYHEKEKLLWLLFQAFPEVNIDLDDVIVYQSNIYNLYNKIVSDCGEDWTDQDIDLPMLVSRWKGLEVELSKYDFTNVILIFDYERHDTYFSKDVICKMQHYFSDINDVGQLFINYPMVESYMDFNSTNIKTYKEKKTKANIKKGNEYKGKIKRTKLYKIFSFPSKIRDILMEESDDSAEINAFLQMLFSLSDSNDLYETIYKHLGFIEDKKARELTYQFQFEICKFGYLNEGLNYLQYIRRLLHTIVVSNIKKASFVQNGKFEIENVNLKDVFFDEIDLLSILNVENNVSDDIVNGFIWVLNTSIFISANYKFFWED